MKKALVYDPYLDTLGGGERYCLTFASALKQSGYEVVLAWPNHRILLEAGKRFGLNLDFFCDAPAHGVFNQGSLLAKWQLARRFDLIFWVSDGSLPFLFGRKNYVHFQVPFKKIGGDMITNLLKTTRINYFIYNSRFTADVVRPQLPLSRSVILYPPIDTDNFKPGKKENLILSVARFDSPSHAKRQDILIEAFEKLSKENKNYKLILAGGLKGGDDYLISLKTKAGKLPIEFIPNPDFKELQKLYAKAKVFWHAAGFGIDEKEEPGKVEHFGMTTVEAMAAGAIPVVIDHGGQREIITAESGFLCQTTDEIIGHTLELLESKTKLASMAAAAMTRAADFSIKRFQAQVASVIAAK